MSAGQLSKLGHADLILLLELVDQSLAVESSEEIKTLLTRLCRHIPTDGVVSVLSPERVMKRLAARNFGSAIEPDMRSTLARMLAQARDTAPSDGPAAAALAVNVGYPAEWLVEYAQNNYFSCDPTKQRLLEGTDYYRWSDSFSKATLQSEKDYVQHAREHGIVDGITVACRQPRSGLLSFFAFRGEELGETERDRIVLRHIAPYLHEAMRRVSGLPANVGQSADQCALSNREKEVLRWAMDGKTNWEISMILNIGERTVKFHVQNVMRKLDASSRSQAVAIAVRRRLIPLPGS